MTFVLSRQGGLFAVPFDLRRHEVTGPPTPVLTGVLPNLRNFYDVSRAGTLVYLQGEGGGGGAAQRRFLFLDRSGRADTVRLTPRPIWGALISPNGRYIAYQTDVGGREDQIQVLDLLTGSTPEVTTAGTSVSPIWSPDGTRLAVGGRRDGDAGDMDPIVVPLDDGAAERRLFTLPGQQRPVAWSAQDEIVIEGRCHWE